MKKLLVIIVILMISGCATIKESEFFEHNSVYADLGHLWFSCLGYRDVDQKDVNKSRAGGWWGITKTYYPQTDKSAVNP